MTDNTIHTPSSAFWPTMSDLAAQLRAHLEGVTEGPWEADTTWWHVGPSRIDGFANPEGRNRDGRQKATNAEFIAWMRNNADQIADALEQADADWVHVVASATPCTCSAQRERADKAEAELAAVHKADAWLSSQFGRERDEERAKLDRIREIITDTDLRSGTQVAAIREVLAND